MKNKIFLAARLLLGLIYVVFGLNGFFNFIALPPVPDQAGAFLGALGQSGYFFPFLKATEVIAGLTLLTGFFAPLGLIILAPITLQIFLFHFFLTPGESAFAIVTLILHLVAAVEFLPVYRPLLQPKSVTVEYK